MIEYTTKDITTVEEGVIAHGVNCQGAMGSGVARALYEKWPLVREQYLLQPTGEGVLGLADKVEIVPNRLYVANCYTQLFYGKGGRFASPSAIEDSLWMAASWADYYHIPLYMPKIGAGLGGLDWEREVVPVIEYMDSKWSRVDKYVCIWGAS